LKTWTFAAVSALALAAAGCQPKPQRAVARLDCPAMQGSLSRVSAAADGKSCFYRAADGAEVQLRLVPVTGGVETTLAALESEALALRGTAPPGPAAASSAASAASADAAAVEAQAKADAGPETPPDEDSADGDDDVDIHLPGLNIRTQGDSANVNLGGMQIDAGDEGATIRKTWSVRLRGEAAATEKRGVRALFIRASGDDDPLPSVGYQAAGPKAGPITAAIVKWTSHGNEEIYGDVRKLVRDNGGA
jgi:hypothetical protein